MRDDVPMRKLTVGSLFSGIGGIDLGLERAGFEIAWQCEIDEYASKVLAKQWPDVARYGDIRECGGSLDEPDALFWLSELRARKKSVLQFARQRRSFWTIQSCPVQLYSAQSRSAYCTAFSAGGQGQGRVGRACLCMSRDMHEYIYKLTDPLTDEVRWVGRTTDPHYRFTSHLYTKKENGEKDLWIAGLQKQGLLPIMEVIETVTDEHPIAREKYWIQWYFQQGAPLFNKTHRPRPSILGYTPDHPPTKRQSDWLGAFLDAFPDELSIPEKWVYLRLYVLSRGGEQPIHIQMKQITEQTGVAYHTLVVASRGGEGVLQHLDRLGLITFAHPSPVETTITVHTDRLGKEREVGA